jgi:flagellar biogenesis protein FliO
MKRLTQPRSDHLAVVDSLALALKRSVTLVRVGDQVVLVGISDQQLTNLGTFPASILTPSATPVSTTLSADAVEVTATPAATAQPAASSSSQRASRALNPDPAFQRLLAKFQERG